MWLGKEGAKQFPAWPCCPHHGILQFSSYPPSLLHWPRPSGKWLGHPRGDICRGGSWMRRTRRRESGGGELGARWGELGGESEAATSPEPERSSCCKVWRELPIGGHEPWRRTAGTVVRPEAAGEINTRDPVHPSEVRGPGRPGPAMCRGPTSVGGPRQRTHACEEAQGHQCNHCTGGHHFCCHWHPEKVFFKLFSCLPKWICYSPIHMPFISSKHPQVPGLTV